VADGGLPDAAWFNPGGDEMEGDDWTHTWARALGLFLNGEAITGADARGEPISDDSFLVFFSAADEAIDFTLPSARWAPGWAKELDTSQPGAPDPGSRRRRRTYEPGATVQVPSRAVVVLRRIEPA
jgi:glycogen operon protein